MQTDERPTRYDLVELCDLVDVTPRTVRYYIQQGLLPSTGQPGPGAKYHDGHLDRLRLIRLLQREHLPLAEIRARLSRLGDEEIPALLEKPAAPPVGSAADYVRAVLSSPAAGRRDVSSAAAMPSARAASPPSKTGTARSQWERIALADDIELHVRRPLSRELNRRFERLLEQARRILNEE